MTRKEIKEWSKEKLKNRNWEILGVILLASLVSGALSNVPIIGLIFSCIINVGLVSYLINFLTDKETKLEMLFSKFSNWKQISLVTLLEFVYVFLWTLLLIIPGIIKGLAYSLVPYILEDEKDMSPSEVLKLSEAMMQGHKWEYFKLNLSFIGWHILAMFTLLIPYLWLIPYQNVVTSKYLLDIKTAYEKEHKN